MTLPGATVILQLAQQIQHQVILITQTLGPHLTLLYEHITTAVVAVAVKKVKLEQNILQSIQQILL